MKEADVKRTIVGCVKARGGYARRIEDQFSVGFPDLVVQTGRDSPVYFIEVKVVRGRKFGPTPRQYVEMSRLAISRYAVPMLVGWHDDKGKFLFHRRAESVCVEDCFVQPEGVDFVDSLDEWWRRERQSKDSAVPDNRGG